MSHNFKLDNIDIAWCPGCGNFSILKIVQQALQELELEAQQTVLVSGIGQAAKLPQYVNTNFFNGLHGRALPAATAIKAANPQLTVIAESGDGDMYGEGGNHFIHAIRRNVNITNIVHNNQIYGLTKGQGSPTSPQGLKTSLQFSGVFNEPFNPLAVALSLKAPFVARTFSGNQEQALEIIKKAIQYPGYALVDIFQPCVTFNKHNTFKWYKENTYTIENHDPADRMAAFKLALQEDKFPLGILYQEKPGRKTFTENLDIPAGPPLYQRKRDLAQVDKLLEATR